MSLSSDLDPTHDIARIEVAAGTAAETGDGTVYDQFTKRVTAIAVRTRAYGSVRWERLSGPAAAGPSWAVAGAALAATTRG